MTVQTNEPQEPMLVRNDPYLRPYMDQILRRMKHVTEMEQRLTQGRMPIADFASAHEYYGLQRQGDEWVFREWAPNATRVFMIGDFSNWKESAQFELARIGETGNWELRLPLNTLQHGQHYKLSLYWPGGQGERVPAYARRVVQDAVTKIFSAQVWAPPNTYHWRHPDYRVPQQAPRIYEAHVGMAQLEARVGTYREFEENVLPRIVDAGYNTIQLMAIHEHPYYGSLGYHVTSFYAASSRFGTPEELKSLVDAAHGAGLAVIMDLVHSHSARNEVEGLSRFDGSGHQYFHGGDRGIHPAWDSRCFDYGKIEVLHFLLSNCRFWLDEYKFDGFRFDGVTSMLYFDHGLGRNFMSYADYFDGGVDEDAAAYLALANRVVHQVRADAITVAEDMSGLPGLGAPVEHGGLGFDYRLAMGVPDYWIKLTKDVPDEQWHVGNIFGELTNRRRDEKTISYAESHDQALVGDQTLIFRMVGDDIYLHMNVYETTLRVDRGVALHKMIRLMTFGTAGSGYLTFMGNEFGHPEWIDFPHEFNNWSYHYARRQWHLRDDQNLRYRFLAEFDKAMMRLDETHKVLQTPGPEFVFEHVQNHLLGFRRGRLIFLFNFDPSQSFADLAVPCAPGKYRLVLDSDARELGGHGRVEPGQTILTQSEETPGGARHHLRVYLPCRVALVFEQVD